MRRLVAVAALLAGCKVTAEAPVAAPAADPTPEYAALLRTVVTDDGYVDYDRLEAERDVLDRYVAWLFTGRLPGPRMARFAHWLNSYNALVLWSVLEDGRPASVLDVDLPGWWPGPPGASFFQQRQFPFPPERLSLSEIEHERLRGRRQDIRIHAALNCASRSCPPLRAEPYFSSRLDDQLDDQMRVWINDPERGVWLEDGTVVFSAIFDWYAVDFDQWTAGEDLCLVAAEWARPALREALRAAAVRGCPHRFAEYDWGLNDVSGE